MGHIQSSTLFQECCCCQQSHCLPCCSAVRREALTTIFLCSPVADAYPATLSVQRKQKRLKNSYCYCETIINGSWIDFISDFCWTNKGLEGQHGGSLLLPQSLFWMWNIKHQITAEQGGIQVFIVFIHTDLLPACCLCGFILHGMGNLLPWPYCGDIHLQGNGEFLQPMIFSTAFWVVSAVLQNFPLKYLLYAVLGKKMYS